MSSGFVIDTPEGIRVAQFLARYHALSIEIKTGMKRSRRGRSTARICREEYGLKGRTKVAVMVEMENMKKELGL